MSATYSIQVIYLWALILILILIRTRFFLLRVISILAKLCTVQELKDSFVLLRFGLVENFESIGKYDDEVYLGNGYGRPLTISFLYLPTTTALLLSACLSSL